MSPSPQTPPLPISQRQCDDLARKLFACHGDQLMALAKRRLNPAVGRRVDHFTIG